MCGIVGIAGEENVCFDLLTGLKHLEYRGYDSSGIATLSEGTFFRQRAQGKLANLEKKLQKKPLPGTIGIGHTRWATHGAPTERNAHPHQGKHVTFVHNGIIENYTSLRLQFSSTPFESETDSEVIAHMLDASIEQGLSPAEAMVQLLKDLRGSYALAILFDSLPNTLIGARFGSPLAIGYGREHRLFLTSDTVAFADACVEAAYLEEGDWVELREGQATIHPHKGTGTITRPRIAIGYSAETLTKEPYRHFMMKEIQEQPCVLRRVITAYQTPRPKKALPWEKITHLSIVACGTSFYAGYVARYWFEQIARLPVRVEIASEFRYSDPVFLPDAGALFISQSGETADTLAALHFTKEHGVPCAGVVNVSESTMARTVDRLLPTYSGIEVGVASTKAFTAQLAVLWHLVMEAAACRGALSSEANASLQEAWQDLPAAVETALSLDASLQELAPRFARTKAALYLGRGPLYPIALEGALKLKEISYIHAEGYAAGELKHGPIALIDDKILVIVLAPHNALFEKVVSNTQEVLARKGRVLFFTDAEGAASLGALTERLRVFQLPSVAPCLMPLVYTIPMQLLAYRIAAFKGTDIDQPRNLAKSVTVE
ncbi:MAG: glutamine--fructose-6-phosphate transaminase (isomerizing) [Holosporales bacterium]|jgi:glucosamine--fructose-6-phosphate aminotransferase (isomerizing)|nr:glutamine--fructose-6-phosphate transaminase (isomerizing) [Holosporales bacterium]